jgi:hypothetical protein
VNRRFSASSKTLKVAHTPLSCLAAAHANQTTSRTHSDRCSNAYSQSHSCTSSQHSHRPRQSHHLIVWMHSIVSFMGLQWPHCPQSNFTTGYFISSNDSKQISLTKRQKLYKSPFSTEAGRAEFLACKELLSRYTPWQFLSYPSDETVSNVMRRCSFQALLIVHYNISYSAHTGPSIR